MFLPSWANLISMKRVVKLWPLALVCFLTLWGVVGCSTIKERITPVSVPEYTPTNIYKADLPVEFIRVALLPMNLQGDFGQKAALDSIEGALQAELIKAKRFEVVTISKDELEQICGEESLSSQQKWPYELKKALEERQVDGVMLIELTHLRGYQPVALGLKMRLVSLQEGKTYWAVDELLDSANPMIYQGALNYDNGMRMGKTSESKTIAFMQTSPTRFAHYAGELLFKTLP